MECLFPFSGNCSRFVIPCGYGPALPDHWRRSEYSFLHTRRLRARVFLQSLRPLDCGVILYQCVATCSQCSLQKTKCNSHLDVLCVGDFPSFSLDHEVFNWIAIIGSLQFLFNFVCEKYSMFHVYPSGINYNIPLGASYDSCKVGGKLLPWKQLWIVPGNYSPFEVRRHFMAGISSGFKRAQFRGLGRPVLTATENIFSPQILGARSPGDRSHCSSRVRTSTACVKCFTSQFPVRLKRGSRSAVGTPFTCRNASRGFASTNAAWSGLAPSNRSITPPTSCAVSDS